MLVDIKSNLLNLKQGRDTIVTHKLLKNAVLSFIWYVQLHGEQNGKLQKLVAASARTLVNALTKQHAASTLNFAMSTTARTRAIITQLAAGTHVVHSH